MNLRLGQFVDIYHQLSSAHKKSSDMKLGLIIGIFLFLSSCYNGEPYHDNGKYPEVEMVAVALTHAILHDDPQLRSQFFENGRNVKHSLKNQPGFIGQKLRRRTTGKEVWTMTVWTSEEALDKFVRGDLHQTAIRNGLAAVKYGEFARTTIPRSEAPLSWKKANKLLKESPRKIYN